MSWGAPRSYPRAILHIDGDAFFASCEVAKNPTLRGKPVITGKERGIVSAATYEAKARGVVRGMELHEVRRICPDAVILPSDYETYSLFSHRMYDIVRRFTPTVEEYGIDECFAEITGMRRAFHASYPEIAAEVKRTLEAELGMTFSIGLSATKVLAKIGSKWQKPSGLTCIPLTEAHAFLAKTPAERVWGIGPNTAALLARYGVTTAAAFAAKDEAWVRARLTKPVQELWHELRGEAVLELDTEGRQAYQSISKTKTFTPPSADAAFLFSQLSKNVENACGKARRWELVARRVSFFLKTQDFRYHSLELDLPHPSALPQDVLRVIEPAFARVYRPGVRYRTTGVTLLSLEARGQAQLDLFGAVEASARLERVLERADAVAEKYGKHTLFLGSSFAAMTRHAHEGARAEAPTRTRALFKGESARRRLGIPFLGEVG